MGENWLNLVILKVTFLFFYQRNSGQWQRGSTKIIFLAAKTISPSFNREHRYSWYLG
jgi:hypothetical protein